MTGPGTSPETGPATRTSKVRVEDAGGIRVITINRPEVRNAIDTETAKGIADALDSFDDSDHLVAAVLCGEGATFCAGMDLKAFLAGERPVIGDRGFAGLTERPPAKPIIAAVEGTAVAGGFEMALACDLIVAGRSVRFGLPEVKRGLVAAGGGLLRLPRHAPYHLVLEWALTGDFLSVDEAWRHGLVNRIVDDGQAVAEARELAASIAVNGPLAVAATKRIIVESQDWSREEMFARQLEISVPVRNSEDAREGARAFAEKRPPRWARR